MESLIALFKAEPFKKTYDIGGVKVTLRMLTREQYDDVMSRANISTEDLISKEYLFAVEKYRHERTAAVHVQPCRLHSFLQHCRLFVQSIVNIRRALYLI